MQTKAANERETVRCPSCKMVQYRARDARCRRCRVPLVAPLTFEEKYQYLPLTVESSAPRSSNQAVCTQIGERLRFLRLYKGQTAVGVSEKAFCSRSHLSRLETGEQIPSVGMCEYLCEVLEITMWQLFSGDLAHVLDEFSVSLLQAYRTLPPDDIEELRAEIKSLAAY